jgi:hypothetical protein
MSGEPRPTTVPPYGGSAKPTFTRPSAQDAAGLRTVGPLTA